MLSGFIYTSQNSATQFRMLSVEESFPGKCLEYLRRWALYEIYFGSASGGVGALFCL